MFVTRTERIGRTANRVVDALGKPAISETGVTLVAIPEPVACGRAGSRLAIGADQPASLVPIGSGIELTVNPSGYNLITRNVADLGKRDCEE